MAEPGKASRPSGKDKPPPKVAIACQGGGIHAAFEVGVLTEILEDLEKNKRFEMVGLSGTSAGALCALMVWLGLAPTNARPGSAREAINKLNRFWNGFVANTPAEKVLNFASFLAFRSQEEEVLGVKAPLLGLSPFGLIAKGVIAGLPFLGVRKQYFEFKDLLSEACPEFDHVDWPKVKTRLLLGASEVVHGIETVFDSDLNKKPQVTKDNRWRWRQRLKLTLSGVVASGTLPDFREAEPIDGGYYWDGLYSQNPPVREFISDASRDERPDELWIIRINPQQWPYQPRSNAEILDRKNELMGNLSLNKELDFILTVNEWIDKYKGAFAGNYKRVTVRTIKMTQKTADELRYSSKFNRCRDFIDELRQEGHEVAKKWLDQWPDNGRYPDDAAYRPG